ncbi:MAG: hypothetical protein Q7U57_10000 [Methylovulum sp.]|nr:hypothetical protein [Methylovulum sp.]
MWKAKLSEWFKYTNSTIRANNKLLPMATKLDNVALLCLKEIEKTEKGQFILQSPHLSQFFFSSYATSLHYHQAIVSASLSKYSLNNLVLIRPQLEAAIIFLYFIDSSSEEELFNKVERYHDWVVVKMHQNSCKSSKLHFVQHLSTHKSFVEQINKNYLVLTQKYAGREKEFNKLSNSSSFVLDKSFVARQNGISNSHYDPKLPYFRLWGSNNWAFRVIRPALQHKIEQTLPAIKAQV